MENTQVSQEAKETKPRTLKKNQKEDTNKKTDIAAPPAQDSKVVIVQTTFFDERQNKAL